MQTLLLIVSFAACMLLTAPATRPGLLDVALIIALGTGLIIWKKPQKQHRLISKLSIITAVFFAGYLAMQFYPIWVASFKVGLIANFLHLSPHMLVVLTASGLGLCSVYFIAGMVQQINNYIDRFIPEKLLFVKNLLLCSVIALKTASISQTMIGIYPLYIGWSKLLTNAAIVLTVILLLYCITREIISSVFVGSGVFILISVINAYVFQFRGRLFEPVDIFSAGTAMNVASNYSLLPIPAGVTVGIFLWLWLCLWTAGAATKKRSILPGKIRIVFAVFCLAGAVTVFGYANKQETHHWEREGAANSGFILDFAAKFKEISVPKPKGYSSNQIQGLADQYPSGETQQKTPHIIAIMSEAYADLGVLGELSTNQPVAPFISSLRENTVSGYALASVYGGNTSNSEYEFLTGNSMAWMTQNTVPYQQYIRSSSYSIVSYLKQNYGYRCIAMHPYLASGWNRPAAYQHFGFDQSMFMEDFPQQDYVRSFISDREMYETVIDVFEKQKSQPLFLFGITMQNHGSYNNTGFENTVTLSGYEKEYPDVNQYLSLIHETDKATEALISYFQQVEEDVVIVFFGDHQPKLNEDFYREMDSSSSNSLEDIQKRFAVPFFVWANYDIDEQYVECTSLNYLSNYMYQVAGIPLPPYNQFLADMEKKIPAVNANGYYSVTAQGYLPLSQATEEEQQWLAQYEKLQYNSLFDKKHRNEIFFPTLHP